MTLFYHLEILQTSWPSARALQDHRLNLHCTYLCYSSCKSAEDLILAIASLWPLCFPSLIWIHLLAGSSLLSISYLKGRLEKAVFWLHLRKAGFATWMSMWLRSTPLPPSISMGPVFILSFPAPMVTVTCACLISYNDHLYNDNALPQRKDPSFTSCWCRCEFLFVGG